MNKIKLYQAAIAFVFANLNLTCPGKLNDASRAAFKAAGQDDADWNVWQSAVTQYQSVLIKMKAEKLPSEQIAKPVVNQPA